MHADTIAINPVDRRIHARFRVNPGYTPVQVRTGPDQGEAFEGHIYDISESGVCFELDHPVAPGTRVSMRIELPGFQAGPGRASGLSVHATGNVVWCDLEEPGASRMAVAITRYDRAGDHERLIRALSAGRYLRAA